MSVCPFCQGEASCGLTQSASCWCFSESIPEQMLALLPVEAQGVACICQACIQAYQQRPVAFRKRYDSMTLVSEHQHGTDSNKK